MEIFRTLSGSGTSVELALAACVVLSLLLLSRASSCLVARLSVCVDPPPSPIFLQGSSSCAAFLSSFTSLCFVYLSIPLFHARHNERLIHTRSACGSVSFVSAGFMYDEVPLYARGGAAEVNLSTEAALLAAGFSESPMQESDPRRHDS